MPSREGLKPPSSISRAVVTLKRDPLDAVFSDLVRERADWTCECCGKYFPERKGSGIHAVTIGGEGTGQYAGME